MHPPSETTTTTRKGDTLTRLAQSRQASYVGQPIQDTDLEAQLMHQVGWPLPPSSIESWFPLLAVLLKGLASMS